MDVTSFDCSYIKSNPVPIGKPIDNTCTYILNPQLKRMPIGVTGELVIGGSNVGSGYVNDRQQTDEKFIADPFHGGIMYRTGDLAYIREDGNIIYCGRKDGQIKLNGQRIELGAIENAVRSAGGVQTAAVLVDTKDGRNFLRAFYSGTEENTDKIEDFCRKTLPPYMIPHVWNRVDVLPLTPNGKRNSKALLELPAMQRKSEGQKLPVSHAEQEICGIFSSVLKNNEIDRNTDFFAAGGTSLSVISALSDPLLRGMPVHEFMQDPTPAGLAEKLQSSQTGSFRLLQKMNEVSAFQKALILFPPAGGSTLSYAALNEEIKKTYPDVCVFGTDFLHTDAEIAGLAEEITKLSIYRLEPKSPSLLFRELEDKNKVKHWSLIGVLVLSLVQFLSGAAMNKYLGNLITNGSYANLIDTVAGLATYNAANWACNIDRWHKNRNSLNRTTYKRGDIVFLDLGAQNFEHEPSYTHACIIVADRYDSILVVPCSTKQYGTGHRGIIDATPKDGFLKYTGIQSESFRWVSKNRVVSQTGRKVSSAVLTKIDNVFLSFCPSVKNMIIQKNAIIENLKGQIDTLQKELDSYKNNNQNISE